MKVVASIRRMHYYDVNHTQHLILTLSRNSLSSVNASISLRRVVINSSSRRWNSVLFQFNKLPIFLGVDSGVCGASTRFS